MSEKYVPGTVATATVRGTKDVRVMKVSTPSWAGRNTDYYQWISAPTVDGCGWHGAEDVTDVRPLVALDLDALPVRPKSSTLAVLRQWQGIARNDGQSVDANVLKAIADQIEAQTKPPRIPEPGVWGVVEARVKGERLRRKFVRHSAGAWFNAASSTSHDWDDLIDPVLVRKGI